MIRDNRRLKFLFALLGSLLLIGLIVKVFILRKPFRYAGTLEATRVDLSAQIASTIQAVKVVEGDHVTLNQELIVLTCEDVKVAHELANQNYTRALRLFRSGTGTQENLDQMKNRKDDAEVRMQWCQISSPIFGNVLNRYHEPGEWVNPGTKLLTLANVRDIWAYIYVPQPEVFRLKPGMNLKGFLPEMKDREFMGHILKINDEAEFTPKNVQTRTERERLIFGVKVSFLGSNDEEILKPGMTIEVQIPEGN